MKSSMVLSFVLHAVFGALGVGWYMLSQVVNPFGLIYLIVFATTYGLCSGLVGIGSGYFFYKEKYLISLVITVVLAVCVALHVQITLS